MKNLQINACSTSCITIFVSFVTLGCVAFAADKKPISRPAKVTLSKTVKVTFAGRIGRGQSEVDGFDNTNAPFWLSVPLKEAVSDGKNSAREFVVPSANIRNIFTKNIAIVKTELAEVTNPQNLKKIKTGFVTVTGFKRGETVLRAMAADGMAGSLNVVVRKRRTLKVNFVLVSDTANHRTKYTPADTDIFDGYLAGANAIWGNQANVYFERNNVFEHKIQGDFEDRIDLQNNIDLITTKQVASTEKADKTVYFVWDSKPNAEGAAREDIVLSHTTTRPVGETLAHELGHTFGLPLEVDRDNTGHSFTLDELMSRDTTEPFIRKSDADRVNNIKNNPDGPQ